MVHYHTASTPEHVAYPSGRRRAQRILARNRLLVHKVRAAKAQPDLGMIAQVHRGLRLDGLATAPAFEPTVDLAHRRLRRHLDHHFARTVIQARVWSDEPRR